MDEMMFKLRSSFLKKVAAKVLSNLVYNKLGYRIDISIDKLEIESVNGDTTVAANVEMKLSSSEFAKIMKKIENS